MRAVRAYGEGWCVYRIAVGVSASATLPRRQKKILIHRKFERWERKERMERRETEKLTITGEKRKLYRKIEKIGRERKKRERERLKRCACNRKKRKKKNLNVKYTQPSPLAPLGPQFFPNGEAR